MNQASAALELVNPLKDEGNPTSVINLVPLTMAKGLKAIPEYVFDLSMAELEASAKCGEIERKLRIAFWLEYERAHRNGNLVNMANVYRGVCSMSNFFKYICTNSFKLAYVLTPPEDYRVQTEEMLMLALKAEREVLTTPIKQTRIITNKQGEQKTVEVVDASLAMVHHKIRESLQNRLQGMPVHRSMQITENRNINTNVSSDQGQAAMGFSTETLSKMSEADLSAYVNSLEGGEGPPARDASVIDVTVGAKDGE